MRIRIRLRARVLVAAVAAVAATGLVAGASAVGHAAETPAPAKGLAGGRAAHHPADPVPAGFPSWAEVFAVQDRLNAAARRIVAARGAGYAGIVAAPANRELRAYWKGAVPAPVRQVADRAGVPVRFMSARYTEREMLAEARRVAADPRVASVAPEADGSGLAVRMAATAGPAGPAVAAGRTGMPLHQRSGGGLAPLINRQDDAPPYWGGAKYKIGKSACSFGFNIVFNSEPRILTAGHCGNNLDIVKDGGGDLVGDVSSDNDDRDTMMIDLRIEGDTLAPSVYTGPWFSSNGLHVGGATEDFVGNIVCTSGARSGENCGITVTEVNTSGLGLFPLVLGESNGCASAAGDSGGPVYSYDPSGLSVTGRGTISLGQPGTARCAHARDRESSRFVLWAPLLRPAGDSTVGTLQFFGGSHML